MIGFACRRLAIVDAAPWILLIDPSLRAVCAAPAALCIQHERVVHSPHRAAPLRFYCNDPLHYSERPSAAPHTKRHCIPRSVQPTAAANSLHAPWRATQPPAPTTCPNRLPSGSFCVSATRQDAHNTNANPMGLPIPVSACPRHDAAACLPANHLQTIVFVIIHQQLYNVLVCA